MPHGPDSEPARPWSVGQVSIGQGLIEREHALGWSASRRQWRGSGGEIEIGEDGADGNGIRNEGDDAHRSTATTLRAVPRADEREDVIDARAMREAQREDVRRPGATPSDEPATD